MGTPGLNSTGTLGQGGVGTSGRGCVEVGRALFVRRRELDVLDGLHAAELTSDLGRPKIVGRPVQQAQRADRSERPGDRVSVHAQPGGREATWRR
jgi:hypothetical protein